MKEYNTLLRISFLSTGMEFNQDIFKKCLSIHSADIAQNHGWYWAYLWKTNAGQKSFSLLGPTIWSKTDPSIKNVRTSSPFMHAIQKNVLLHLQS